MTDPVLQTCLPPSMHLGRALPGVQPLADHDWLWVDEAYGGQMALRAGLLGDHLEAVHYLEEGARAAAEELLEVTLALLPAHGFAVGTQAVTCPDGRVVDLDFAAPLITLGRLVQQDLVLMQKRGDVHVLAGAVLCFPASWLLAEKAGHPLVHIHGRVEEYDADLARRVQRLFDGVRVGRPLWRANRLWYADATLHQPRSATAPREIVDGPGEARYYRSERQCIFRLPRTDVVVFSIHTFVLNKDDVPVVVTG